MKSQIRKANITKDRTEIENQAEYMENVIKYFAINPYGFISKAKKDSMVLLMNLNGDQSNKVGIEYDNKKLLDTLKTGESALYHPDKKSYVICRNNGDIELVSKDGNATIKIQNDGKIAIGVNGTELLDVVSTFADNVSTFADTAKTHTHTSAVGATGPPIDPSPYTTLKSDADSVKSDVDSIKGSF